jgi:hypothetical protein
MSVKLTQKMLNSWLESAWRDGYTKGVDGNDNLPDFSTFDPRGPEDGKKLSATEASSAEFNPCKCAARMFREGCGVQCTRKPFEGGRLCKTHQKNLSEQGEGFDLPFGWFDKERPTHHLDEKQHGKPIAWSDAKKSKSSSTKKRVPAKEMREQLTEMGISIDGLKGKELTLKYNDVMESKSETSSANPSPEPSESSSPPPSEPGSPTPSTGSPDGPYQDPSIEENHEIHLHTNSAGEQTEVLIYKCDDIDSGETDEDSGAGTGLPKKSDSKPNTTAEFKKLFQELGISADGLKGKKAYVERYEEYLKEKEPVEEETEDMSDDELETDTSNFTEIDYEGVEYLEDEDTGLLYNSAHQAVGKWNDGGDEIIWSSDTFRIAHETMKD